MVLGIMGYLLLPWCGIVGAVLAAVVGFCYPDQAPNYTFLHDAALAPKVSYYDYIIVGGGTAGCPLAATLSQNYSVLLIERGGSPYGNPNITDLPLFGAPLIDHSPESPAQPFISEDGVFNARARVLGGGSCLNAGFYTRASVDYVEKAGWDGKLVNQSYHWAEKLVVFEPPMLQWQTAVRDGLLEVGVTPNNGFSYDHLLGTKVGGTIFDRQGHRHTAADLLRYANPKGLTVLLNATVHRIVFRKKRKPNPAAHGVVFTDASGIKHRAYLKKGTKNEIIISAGALGSPQLLMLSGIGPTAHLRSHNITVVLNQPMVGQGMSDNPMNAVYIPSPLPVETSLVQIVGITRFGSYIESISGINILAIIGQMQISENFEPQTTGEVVFTSTDRQKAADSQFRGGFIAEKVLGPLSTGHLALRNKNPHDNPSVTFNYFKEPGDLRRCAKGISLIKRVIQSKAFSKFTYPDIPVQTLLNITASFRMNLLPKNENTSSSPQQFCKDTVMTIWHYHGGCMVGKVVDRDYQVIGVDSLRVIDGSTLRYSPGANPQATIMMLGRYMGVQILNERLKSDGYI